MSEDSLAVEIMKKITGSGWTVTVENCDKSRLMRVRFQKGGMSHEMVIGHEYLEQSRGKTDRILNSILRNAERFITDVESG